MSILDKILKLVYSTSRQNLIYKVYEKHLTSQINQFPFPQHIGIILDGNRRWSKIMDIRQSERSSNGCRHC